MATSSNDSGFESMVKTVLGEDVTLEKLLWELTPTFFKIKCPEDFITVVDVSSSADEKIVTVSIYMLNELSISKIAYISACLDAFARSYSDKWDDFTYSFQPIVSISEEYKLNKYIFETKNRTEEDLAGKNQKFIKSIR